MNRLYIYTVLCISLLFTAPCALYAGDAEDGKPLTLEQCRSLALQNNKDLASASIQKAAAEHLYKSYRANFYPNLYAQGIAGYSNADGALSIAGGNLPVLALDPSTGMLVPNGSYAYFPGVDLKYKTEMFYIAGVSLEQPLYMGGKVRSAYKLAKIGRDVAGMNESLTATEVIVKTEEAYVLLVKAQQMKEVAVKYNAVLKELMENVESAYKHGLKPQNDLLKVTVKLNESLLAVRKAENALRLAMMNLCHYIGKPLTSKITVSDELPNVAGEVTVTDITERLEYQMLNKQVEAAGHQVRLARSEMLPQLGLKGMYSYMNALKVNDSKLLNGFSGTAMVSLKFPIFHFGAQNNKVRAAKEQLAKAEAEKDSKDELMLLELTKAINELDEAMLEREIADRSLSQAEENMRLSKSQYNNGLETLSDYLESQALWQSAYATKVDAYFQLYLKNLSYMKAAGLLNSKQQ